MGLNLRYSPLEWKDNVFDFGGASITNTGCFGVGDTFYVSNVTGKGGVDNGNNSGKSFNSPFKTIDYAIGRCTADNSDVIVVMSGHSETISAAGGITADVAGVTIVGVGFGTNRPIITFSATASTLLVTAANVAIKNMQIQNTIDAVVSGIGVSAAGFQLIGNDFSQPTSTHDTLIWLITTAAADDMLVAGNTFRQSHAGPTECIRLVGADRAKIIDNFIIGSYSTAVINGITTASTEILISGNTISNSVIDALAIDLVASCTGQIEYTRGSVASTAAMVDAAVIDAANCQLTENYFSDAVGQTGKLIGTVSAN